VRNRAKLRVRDRGLSGCRTACPVTGRRGNVADRSFAGLCYDRSMRGLRLVLALSVMVGTAGAKEDPDTEIARRHYSQGLALYEAARYREAVVEFEAARKLRPSHAFDFNIARCYDRLEEPAAAIEAYQRYLAAPVPPEDAEEVRQRIEVLRQRLPRPPVQETVAPVETPRSQPPPPRPRLSVALPVSFLLATAVSAVTGGTLYAVSGQRYDNLVSSGCGRTVACSEDRYRSTRQMEQAGIGLLIAGGVLAAVDVVVWAVWAKRHHPQAAARSTSFASSEPW
jgi:tetratricopeptide (TPR) repeat protein